MDKSLFLVFLALVAPAWCEMSAECIKMCEIIPERFKSYGCDACQFCDLLEKIGMQCRISQCPQAFTAEILACAEKCDVVDSPLKCHKCSCQGLINQKESCSPDDCTRVTSTSFICEKENCNQLPKCNISPCYSCTAETCKELSDLNNDCAPLQCNQIFSNYNYICDYQTCQLMTEKVRCNPRNCAQFSSKVAEQCDEKTCDCRSSITDQCTARDCRSKASELFALMGCQCKCTLEDCLKKTRPGLQCTLDMCKL